MVGKKEIRNYEVSVWTLQDSFITVLKPSNLENKGQIMDGSMTLKDDGDNKLSFKIPMYIRNNKGELIENHLWYNTINGVIISGLRKIKVIFNKNTEDEAVYEFVIVDVNESHEGKQQYCQVDCEGLAFHELGKQGFKISLEGADEIDRVQKSFIDNPEESGFSTLPIGNLNYWADRIFEGSNWRYSIQMDWSAQDGITYQEYTLPSGVVLRSTDYENFTEEEKIQFNILRSQDNSSLWRRNKIYEEPFITSWHVADNETNLQPTSIKEQEEKIRMVEGKESNRYNLSQSVAEMFQVFCRYKYYYDENYHIIDREAIFYNNFLNEFEGVIDLTYSYNTQHLTRNMDSKDVVSKMYVAPLSDADSPTEKTSISDTPANRSLEDYILNFDYLYNIGTITQEQYDAIEPFEMEVRKINEEYNSISNSLISLNAEVIKQKAIAANAEQSYKLCLEELGKNNDLKANLTGGSGVIPITALNPKTWTVFSKTENNLTHYYCNASEKGILASTDETNTLHLYRSYNSTNHTLSDEIPSNAYKLIKPQGDLTQIEFNAKENSRVVYAIFDYDPQFSNEIIIQTLQDKMAIDQNTSDRANARLKEIELEIKTYTTRQTELLIEKKNKIDEFERLMGPALREGKWQPEDQYTGYGEPHDVTLNLFSNQTNNVSTDELASFIWDNELFNEEQKYYYEEGLTQTKIAYPCIEITENILTKFSNWADTKNFTQRVNFVYSTTERDEPGNKRYLAIDSQMIFGFLRKKENGDVIPVLILTGLKSIEEIYSPHLAFIQINQDTGQIEELESFTNLQWTIPIESIKISNVIDAYETVFPRIKIDSNTLRSPNTNITMQCRGETIANYSDFYIMSRVMGYFITVKPHVIISMLPWGDDGIDFSIHFVISTAALAIYLDALKVAKENAYPKVSYEIDVASVNENFSHKLYTRLGQIAHINDAEFKFENTMGYISEITLDLDRPWQDKVIIKNYKTKFEDLFSTIVAETEQMQKNAAAIGIAAGAFHSDGTLDESIFAPFLQRVLELTTVNVPTPESVYLEVEPYIRTLLRNTYKEAGEILEAANESVAAVNDLNIQNSEILALYRENVRQNLTPQTFKLGDFNDNGTITTYNKRYNASLGVPDTVNFKVGDILEYGYQKDNKYIVDTYVATEHSSQVIYGLNDDKSSSLKGWSLLKDGSLAQIKGANLNINADAGIISILAENELNVASGGKLKLAGENVQIIGNSTVEIGGPDVKIYAASANSSKGIHLYSTTLGETNETNTIDITGNGIKVAAADGIQMKAGKELNFYSSNITDNGTVETSVISISSSKGIYLGSTQGITFYSGLDTVDVSSSNASLPAASAKISSERILFGVADSASGSAIDISKQAIILGSTSNYLSELNLLTGTSQVSGVYISQEAIRMATQPEGQTYRNLISMDNNGIIISASDSNNNGAFVQVNRNGVSIGTAPESGAENSPFITAIKNGGTDNANLYSGPKFQVYAPNFVVTDQGKLYAYDAYIAGTIYANGGQIGNWNLTTSDNGGYLFGGSGENQVGFKVGNTSGDISFWAGNTPENAPFRVTNTGNITAESGSIGGWNINSNQINKEFTDIQNNKTGTITLNSIAYSSSNSIHYNPIFSVFYDDEYKFYVRSNGELFAKDANITGAITATSLILKDGNTETGIDAYIQRFIPPGQDLTLYIQKDGTISGEESGTARSFTVSSQGLLTASNAIISGTIYASAGTISGWDINNTSIYKNCILSGENTDRVEYYQVFMNSDAYTSSNEIHYNPMFGVYYSKFDDAQNSRIYDYQFYVRSNGELYAKNANIQGTIIATSGTIGGCSITGGELTIDSAHISGTLNGKKITGGSLYIYNELNKSIYQGSPSISRKPGTSAYIDADSVGALQIYANDLAVENTIQGTVQYAQSLTDKPSIQTVLGVVPSQISITVGGKTSDGFTVPYAQSAGSAGNITGTIAIANGGTGTNNIDGVKQIFGIPTIKAQAVEGKGWTSSNDGTNYTNNYSLGLSKDKKVICVFCDNHNYICHPYVSGNNWYADVTTNSGNPIDGSTTISITAYYFD